MKATHFGVVRDHSSDYNGHFCTITTSSEENGDTNAGIQGPYLQLCVENSQQAAACSKPARWRQRGPPALRHAGREVESVRASDSGDVCGRREPAVESRAHSDEAALFAKRTKQEQKRGGELANSPCDVANPPLRSAITRFALRGGRWLARSRRTPFAVAAVRAQLHALGVLSTHFVITAEECRRPSSHRCRYRRR